MLRITVTGLDWYRQRFQHTPWVVGDAFAAAVAELAPRIKYIISDVFSAAAADAGEGFPSVYLESLLTVLNQQRIDTMTITDGFNVFFDLEQLGTYDDLMEGFHYMAALEGGGYSDIPYSGEPLKNSILVRYMAWLRLFDAAKDDTYQTRAEYWTSIGKAPQWLLLNFGQTLYAPYIQPYPVLEMITSQLQAMAFEIVERNLNNAMAREWGKNYTTTYAPFTKRPNYGYIRIGNKMAGSYKIR